MSLVSTLKPALLLIDVQQSFTQMPFWQQGILGPFETALRRLEAGCRPAGVPVVHIFHVGLAGPFRQDSGFVRPLPCLPGHPPTKSSS